MPQGAFIQPIIRTSNLISGPYTIRPDALTSGAPIYQHLMVTAIHLGTASVPIPIGAQFAFIGFPVGNAVTVTLGGNTADTGIAIGPTGWAAVVMPLQTVVDTLTLGNASGTDVTMEVVIL